MGIIFNIDEAIKNSAVNVLQEPVQMILDNAAHYACVVTTEKDYMRMLHTPLIDKLAEKLIVLPMQTDLGVDKEVFDRAVLLYVDENVRKLKHSYIHNI